jgi:hypothetical protein
MNQKAKAELIAGIERCLDSAMSRIEKKTILVYCKNDLSGTMACLNQWESEGKLEVLKPLDEAADDEAVVRMKTYIEGKSPWPNWPPKD